MIYLISHVNSAGTGIGQYETEANSEAEAKELFALAMPERVFSSISTKES